MYQKSIFYIGEIMEYSFYKSLFAEFFGTFLLLFLGVSASGSLDTQYRELITALCYGFVFASLVLAFGPFSGCHLNPVITFAMVCIREATIIRGIGYSICQWLGAMLGAAVIYGVTGRRQIGVTKLGSPQLGAAQGILMETMTTTLLVLVFLSVTDKCRFGLKSTSSVAIGMAITAGNLASLRYTGGSMNPARSFGPALMNGYFDNFFVYIVAPYIGSICAVIIYKVVLKPVASMIPVEQQSPLNNYNNYDYYNYWF